MPDPPISSVCQPFNEPQYHCLSFLSFLCIQLLAAVAHAAVSWAVSSPDGKLVAEIRSEPDGWLIRMQRNKKAAVPASPIGITCEKAGLLPGSRAVSHAETRQVDDTYLMPVLPRQPGRLSSLASTPGYHLKSLRDL